MPFAAGIVLRCGAHFDIAAEIVGRTSCLPEGLPAPLPLFSGRMPVEAGWKPAPLSWTTRQCQDSHSVTARTGNCVEVRAGLSTLALAYPKPPPMKTILSHIQFIFCIVILSFAPAAFAGDIAVYGLVKEQRLVQTNNAAPVPDAASPFSFQCFVDSTGPDLITSASVSLPSSAMRTLTADGEDSFAFLESFPSASALNSAYGTGTYTLTIDSENDFNAAQLSLPSAAFPNAPQITNYTAAQAINPINAFTLAWLPFSGGTGADFIEFTIRDSAENSVFRSGELGSNGHLNGTNTSMLIPPGSLFPGETYQLDLMFAKIVTRDTSSIPNATGVVGFLSRTSIGIKTTGEVPKVSLQVISIAAGSFQFRFNTQPGKAYQVQFADSLPDWQNYFYTNATSSEVVITDGSAGSGPRRFFRVMVP